MNQPKSNFHDLMRAKILASIQNARTTLAALDPASPEHAKWTSQLQSLTALLERLDKSSPQSEIQNAPFHPENRNAQENQPLATGTPPEQPRNDPGIERNDPGTDRNIPEHSTPVPDNPPPQPDPPFTPREVKLSELPAHDQEYIFDLLDTHTYKQAIALLAEPPAPRPRH